MCDTYDGPDFRRILNGKQTLLGLHPLSGDGARAHVADQYARLGSDYLRLRAYFEALTCFKKAYALIPKDHWLVEIASLYKKMNRLEDLGGQLSDLQRIGSQRALYLCSVYDARKGRCEQALQRIRQLIERPNKDKRNHINMLYLLAQLPDQAGDYHQAFKQFGVANRTLKDYSQNEEEDLVSRARNYRQSIRENTADYGHPQSFNHPPCHFIVGFPRSGTTLIDQILDAHPLIDVLEEDGIFSSLIEKLNDTDVLSNKSRRMFAEAYTGQLQRNLGKTSRCPVDKMPLHIVWLNHIRVLLPGSKVIVMIRDPRDVVLSNFFQNYEINAAMYWILDLQTCAGFYADVMGRYLRIRDSMKASILEVRYEKLVGDLEGTTRHIADFLEIPWDENMLNFFLHARGRDIKTPSASQVVQPIYTTSRKKWRRYADELRLIESVLAPFVEAFGYS